MISTLLDRLEPLLRDPRDRPLLSFALRAVWILPSALGALLLPGGLGGLAIVVHLALYLTLLERFITWYHDLNHRRLFQPRLALADALLVHGVGALFGSTPFSYGAHHVLMHHPTNNLSADLSSTLPYQRDSLTDFLRYYVRFFFCLRPLYRFLRQRLPARRALARRLVAGELGWWAAALAVASVKPWAALAVFGLPVLISRSLLIIGNWGEHAFVDPEAPDNLYRSSLDLLGDAVNQRCFNVGYHIGHHVRPGAHWSALPAWSQANQAVLGREDAVVLRDLHYPDVWWLLMRGRYAALAERFVQLPGAPARDQAQIIALLRARVARVPLVG